MGGGGGPAAQVEFAPDGTAEKVTVKYAAQSDPADFMFTGWLNEWPHALRALGLELPGGLARGQTCRPWRYFQHTSAWTSLILRNPT